ncbi:hypothetical protein PF005_g31143 [Phytophthora fragariae]|uniref:Uncharacterized protein n=2 Tax=Phytophthora fragariae TaxID=53985 RepID=A0A6A3GQ65_9STRA|nr:hypothetical protein PF011_g30385 [Phytophthora fragariae]KAE9059942.1 hypothetical protein PF007_g30782 [Phytophthora fragariae]KAE9161692.1 hypothetical protein PF005_g31143 [Phytophthora fragariae]KAE9162777.1 hypothetical protein PF004_g30376 [Phytophthora fragariae]KAE9165535.1 hypothetical protein PF002_g31345 [Phytophthora fragariae]
MSLQVDLQGNYTIERFNRLSDYSQRVSVKRLVFISLVTPLPCIVLSILKEVPPLKPIEAGVVENWVFFIRAWIVSAIVGGSIPVMVHQDIPRLTMTAPQVVFVALLGGAVAMILIGVACAFTFFPWPFGVLIVGLPLMCVEAFCHIRLVDHQLQVDGALWTDIKSALASIHCLVWLTFIYPLYIYGFVSLSGTGQVLFVAVLPIMKLIAKNWMNFTLSGRDEIKPEMIVFVVEVFNSLYISSALQSTSSWASTATVMASDLAGFWVSMVDITEALSEITRLMKKIPRRHPLAKESFVQIAGIILAANKAIRNNQNTGRAFSDSLKNTKKQRSTNKPPLKAGPTIACIYPEVKTAQATYIHTETPKRKLFQGSPVVPVFVPRNQGGEAKKTEKSNTATTMTNPDIVAIFSREERTLFIHKSMHVLFITEYVILFEYIEVMMPLVYCLFRVALFHLPNRIYFSTMAGLSSSQLLSSTLTVLAYSSLEFVSFVIAVAVMKGALGFNPLRQLAFVLDTQAGRIQTKLIVILLYVTQMPLAHLGADFSFKFAWIPGNQTTNS